MGRIVALDSGRRYEVAPDDFPTSALWYGSQEVRVVPSRSKVFSVRLHNESTGDFVKARPFVEAECSSGD
jgi:hypothetical protein